MSISSNCIKAFAVKKIFQKPFGVVSCLSSLNRSFADKPKQDVNKPKHIQLQGTENEERMRVRRARPADMPRVLRFVRENASSAWPDLTPPPGCSLVICDYVARALAQGHSMLAEQQESRRGWSKIRGLALCMAVCEWDASMLERWARCIRCTRSKRFMEFTAHCLRAPSLHDKYHVHKMLQVIVIVPSNCSTTNSEVVQLLTKNVIQRGRETGFSVLRFDVTNEDVANVLDELNLKRECQIGYNAPGDTLKQSDADSSQKIYDGVKSFPETIKKEQKIPAKFITIYTAFTDNNLHKS